MAVDAGKFRPGVLGACLVIGLGVSACSAGPARSTHEVAAPGCPGARSLVHLGLRDSVPVPVVRIPRGGCVAVSVPRSPFAHHATDPTQIAPTGRLALVSDSLLPDGTRTAYYTALRGGTTTITSTVTVRTARSVPQWSGLVIST